MERPTIQKVCSDVDDEANTAVSNLSEIRAFLEQKQANCIRFYSGLLPALSVLGAAAAAAAFLVAPIWAAWVVTGIVIAAVVAVLLTFLRERKIWRMRVSGSKSVFHALADMPPEEQEKYLCLFAKIIRAGLEICALHVADDVRLSLSDGRENYELILEEGVFRCQLEDGRLLCLSLD